MTENRLLTWSYAPPDFFGEPQHLQWAGAEIEISDGTVTAEVSADSSTEGLELVWPLWAALTRYFQGAQVFNRRPFSLAFSVMTASQNPNQAGYTMAVGTGGYLLSGGQVEFVHSNKDGVVLRDTKAEKLHDERALAQLALKHMASDATADAILSAHLHAISDPDDFLVHLYEIYEALKNRFGNQRALADVLGISIARIKVLTKLADGVPVEGSRHRGRHAGQLRPATEAEKQAAFDVAQELIRAYLTLLG